MLRFFRYMNSSIGMKQIMALTGLSLSLFVLMHMAGNLLVLVGPEIYNKYGHAIVSNPLLYLAEAGLVLLFLTHVFFAIRLTIANHKAKPNRYAVCAKKDRGGVSIASKSLIYSGFLILIFVVLHLRTFKYGPHYSVAYGEQEIRDLYQLIFEIFSEPGYVAYYIISMIILGMHLSHGISSTMQSFGWNHPNMNPCVQRMACILSFIITIGFSIVPLFIYFRG